MAEDKNVLGVSAHLEIDDLLSGFERIIATLSGMSDIGEEAAAAIQEAFAKIEGKIKDGDTVSAIDMIGEAMNGLKAKVIDTLQAFAEGKTDLAFTDVSALITQYRDISANAFAQTQAAYNAEVENVERLRTALAGLLEQSHQLAEAGDTKGFEDLGKSLTQTSEELITAQSRLTDLKNRLGEAEAEAAKSQKSFERLAEGAKEVASAENVDNWRELGGAVKELAENCADSLDEITSLDKNIEGLKAGFELLPMPIQNTVKGIGKMTVAALKFLATPLGLVLGAIAIALKAVHTWFNKSAEGQKAFAKISAFLSSLLESLTQILVKVGDYLYHAFADADGALHDYAKSLIHTFASAARAAYHSINGLVMGVKALYNYLEGQSSSDTMNQLAEAWKELEKGVTNVGETFTSAAKTLTDGYRGVGRVIKDGWNSGSLEDIKNFLVGSISQAREAMTLAGQQLEIEQQLADTKEEQLKLSSQIAEKEEEITKLSGSDKQREIANLRKLNAEYFDKEINLRRKALAITQAQNKGQVLSLEQLQAEQGQRMAILRIEQQKAAVMRRNTQMAESASKAAASEASKAAKAAAAQANRDKRTQIAVGAAETKYNDIVAANTEARVTAATEIEEKITDARIAAMKEGGEKVKAERERAHQKELQQIASEQAAAVKAETERQRAEFDATQAIIKASGGLPEQWDSKKHLDTAEIEKIKNYYKILAELAEARFIQNTEKDSQTAMDDYLRKYGDFQQKKGAILREYERKISEAAGDSWKELQAEQERDEALNKLKKAYGLVAQEMSELFAESANKSLKEIDKIIKKYEALIAFMQGQNGQMYDSKGDALTVGGVVTLDDLIKLGFSDAQIAKVQNGEIAITDIIKAVEKLKKELRDSKPITTFFNDLKNGIEKIKASDLKNGITEITRATANFIPTLEKLGKLVANSFGDENGLIGTLSGFVSGLVKAVDGVTTTFYGDTETGLEQLDEGLSEIVKAIKEADDSNKRFKEYEKLAKYYNDLVSVWDSLIAKKSEYISMSYGNEILQVTAETTELLNKEAEAWRKVGRERLNAGANWEHHSIGVKIINSLDSGDWADIEAVLGKDARRLLGGRLLGLFDLTSEQLQSLKESAPAFWAKLDEETRNYLENIIEGAQRLEDIEQQAKERLTQISFDSMVDNFVNSLMDMDKEAAQIADNVSQYFMQAMLKNKVGELYGQRLEDWYNNFAEGLSDGELTAQEMSELRADYGGIVSDAMKLREQLAEASGFSANQLRTAAEIGGSYKAAQSFTQEQGEEMNGRLTAIQIAQYQAAAQRSAMIEQGNANSISLATVADSVRHMVSNIADIKDIQADALNRLTAIKDNTSVLPAMARGIEQIERHTRNI